MDKGLAVETDTYTYNPVRFHPTQAEDVGLVYPLGGGERLGRDWRGKGAGNL